jgi:hypothetical protein
MCLVIACGSSGGGGGESGGVDSSGAETSSAAMETTGGSSSDDASTDPDSTGPGSTDPADSSDDGGTETGDGTGLTHGSVGIEFRRAPSEDDNPYVGTTEVRVAFHYGECLLTFYDAHPELRQDGAEGAAVFGGLELGGEGWSDRLCDDSSEHLDCEVVSITQDFENTFRQLEIVFTITGDLDGQRLRAGPLPTSETAACRAEMPAIVRFGTADGRAADGSEVWRAESFSPTQAVVDQGAPFVVYGAVP